MGADEGAFHAVRWHVGVTALPDEHFTLVAMDPRSTPPPTVPFPPGNAAHQYDAAAMYAYMEEQRSHSRGYRRARVAISTRSIASWEKDDLFPRLPANPRSMNGGLACHCPFDVKRP